MRSVASMSSGLGSRLPEGWLWARTMAVARSLMGSEKTSRGWTIVRFETHCDHVDTHELVGAVEHDDDEVLLLSVPVVPDKVEDTFGVFA